ncbi:hypothetical protein SISSUDRAFT_1047663 [Sistotremastrum suecicum HHB10207 ss-3]|uniref:SWI/SNF and RSC complexes subunit Ssr4 N-terminal domain-containing protein n=1 Tax=Sistotremastrum suecicum HHB10207 ss-3 TaxID=1314776 RepID=A0A166D2B2_9AGAM|nr:hypothetical protein SISSUDRAFT_1047663 [Sistotremastrum suecicum HHB10207 ss-3]
MPVPTSPRTLARSAFMRDLCLRYPEALAFKNDITMDVACRLLRRTHSLAEQTPFVWNYIDRPPVGSLFVVFLVPQSPIMPVDGIRYLGKEQTFTVTPFPGIEVEVSEMSYGFIPGTKEQHATLVRRRYRFTKGGNEQLMLVHYQAGHATPIPPHLNAAPARTYPLPTPEYPRVFVLGERVGQSLAPPVYPGEKAKNLPRAGSQYARPFHEAADVPSNVVDDDRYRVCFARVLSLEGLNH